MPTSITYHRDYVYIAMRADTGLTIKMLMFALDLTGFTIIFLGFYEWFLIGLIIGFIWTLFFGWLTLWSCFGREMIWINKNYLSYQLDYGLYQSRLETSKVRRALHIALIPSTRPRQEAHYQLIFESFDETGVPHEIYRTALCISERDLSELKGYIRQLYFEKIKPAYITKSFLLN